MEKLPAVVGTLEIEVHWLNFETNFGGKDEVDTDLGREDAFDTIGPFNVVKIELT